MSHLINQNQSDPFDRTQPCRKVTRNRVVQDIIETLSEVDKKKNQIEKTKIPISQDTQTDTSFIEKMISKILRIFNKRLSLKKE